MRIRLVFYSMVENKKFEFLTIVLSDFFFVNIKMFSMGSQQLTTNKILFDGLKCLTDRPSNDKINPVGICYRILRENTLMIDTQEGIN